MSFRNCNVTFKRIPVRATRPSPEAVVCGSGPSVRKKAAVLNPFPLELVAHAYGL